MNIHYQTETSRDRRRGVVLILVLGMLALLALIGVTFATFASQSKIGARNFAQSVNTPAGADLMDYALSQLINDTNNPLSAIRGHSLKRDMYGNDGATNGFLTSTVNGPLYLTKVTGTTCVTNIPYVSPIYVGWTLKLAPTRYGFDPSGNPVVVNGVNPTMQSFVVIADGPDSTGSFHQFQLSASDALTATVNLVRTPAVPSPLIQPASAVNSNPFILDGRYRFAFNGPGIKDAYAPGLIDASGNHKNPNPAQYGNFRYNAGFLKPGVDASAVATMAHGDPNSVGMDEDYDACDLENWFLAIQSADGNTVVPSFHRPGILSATDWSSTAPVQSLAKILRPRGSDHTTAFQSAFPDPAPNASGIITFDVDNDADGKTDSVWLDLGYPPRRNAQGKLYKPLFAFMVIGLNGRIPLNTAGNLAGRSDDDAGSPLAGQTSNLGNSVSEVDPTYALQNAYNNAVNLSNPVTGDPYGQFDDSGYDSNSDNIPDKGVDVRTVQLQNLLAGTRPIPPEVLTTNPLVFTGANAPVGSRNFGDLNYAPIGMDAFGNVIRYYMPNGVVDTSDRATDGTYPIALADVPTSLVGRVANTPSPIPGRWGEAPSISGGPNAPGPHVPAPLLASTYNNPARAGYSMGDRDVDDDNLNAFDPYGAGGSTHQGEVDDSDYYDSSNAPRLAVERMRRFVTPVDIDGSGHVVQWPGSSSTRYGTDSFGRVAFLSYFRPAGLPSRINFSSAALPVLPFDAASGDPAIDTTNNPLHGYDSYRFPFRANATRNSQRVGGMPVNTPLDGDGNVTATTGTTFPTYDNSINGLLHTDGQNEADEMNLYATSRHDQPYGPSDLEWLYRYQDVDGSSLSSRLSQLAPISFTNTAPIINPVTNAVIGADSLRRRRLFSIDSWELTNYAWANDNPQNAFPNNSRYAANQRANTGFPVTAPAVQNGYTTLLHRDKKINLNYPLPVSNNPVEPVRQKWIRETYLTLKAILPPLAVDTAEELAQLSQFVVNIIDFRDPDCAMTRFVNTDIKVNVAAATTASTTLTLNTATVTNPYDPTLLPASGYLIQYGMEYNPIALNEVLAYSFMYNTSNSQTSPVCARNNRFFIELVNTLTDSAAKGVGGLSASNLSLGGFNYTSSDPYANGTWDLVFTKDDSLSRPDPFTGQLLNATGSYYSLIPLNRDSFNALEGADLTLLPLPPSGDPGALANKNPPILPLNYYCVIGNKSLSPGYETNEPAKTTSTPESIRTSTLPPATRLPLAPTVSRELRQEFDPVAGSNPTVKLYPGVLPGITSTTTTAPANYQWKLPTTFPLITGAKKTFTPATDSKPLITYYWVCLRRPANPFAQVSPANPMVVVDAMRFPYMDATNQIDASGTPTTKPIVTQSTGYLAYSVQRWQPYRGGHAVPRPENPGLIDSRYGFTEQMVPPAFHFSAAQVGTYGSKGIFDKNDPDHIQYATSPIYHSLGEPGGYHNAGGIQLEAWNQFPFNDRDFTSVAELLLVPGCSPGLFTKGFVEFAASTANSGFLATAVPQSIPVLGLAANNLPIASSQASNTFSSSSNIVPTANPYLIDKFFYSAANVDTVNPTSTVDNQTSAGWYKMFEFFEVPSQSMGAYGPVAQGANFDWFRQDLKPGLINLNLIIDEEVFFSVFGKQDSNYVQKLLNTQATFPAAVDIPAVVTSINPATGVPMAPVKITNNGFSDFNNTTKSYNTYLKSAFIEFLKLRHGGSGYLFGFGTAPVGATAAGIPADRPFRSLSYPDINQTIMRPASLPPSAFSNTLLQNTAAVGYAGDPGLKNPFRYPGYITATAPAARSVPPAIPARRLLQPPDTDAMSNASLLGDPYINTQTNDGKLSVDVTPPFLTSVTLGGANDNSPQPYFRTEMLQKAMNLTTVRTHQYAVWITVGFFEVTRPGNADLIDSAPTLAYDKLGREIGLNGKIIRYRGFYVVDRTRATGFAPGNPGDYHSCVVYGHVIQ
jgi:hypothetical protein